MSVRGTVRRDFTDDNVNIDRVSGGVAVVIPFGRPSSVQKADAAIAAESARMADEIEQQTRDLFAFRYRQAEQDAKAAYLAAREARVMAEAAKVRWQYGTGTPEEYLSALARWMQADYAALRAEQERLLLVFRTAAFFGVPFRDFADYMAYLPWPM
ncbi:MAG: hypothetical protein KatS3mg082_1444 [Nitrospiraceae bacterium]|nr:MAG: hypothetical protein KatS3mg082_1444 [Nitrospiraceae bacterium]